MKNSKAFEHLDGSEIAIIGMTGRFPGAENIDAFWNNLRDGVESITFFTTEQLQASGVNHKALNDTNYVKARPVLDGIELFDAAFFGFSPREASGMDPQHRLFLECVWEAIETAGYDAESYKGAIGVFAGAGMSTYLIHNLYANQEAMALAGEYQCIVNNSPDSLTTRVAYKLNLKGPCYTVQTFCSTALVAVHIACQSLLDFECDMAVAGGVSVYVPQNTGYWFHEVGILSPDGHCRPFDAKAQGTLFGNGSGVVVLKRIEDALADGDHIDAVIKGSATNNDGSLKVSYTAPSVTGQAEVIVEALANAGVEPETISYVETHGTGTTLGDPAEVTAVTRAFRTGTQKKGFCAIGSVKSNIGHLDRASGVAGLIKTVLVLKHKEIPPSLHFENPNPEIDFENSPFYVNSSLSEWKSDGIPRRAGVSAFGFGGTNAHVIVQEAPDREASGPSRPWQLLLLSARTSTALDTATKNLVKHLQQHPHINLADAAYTLQVGRKAFNHRRMIACQDVHDAISTLEAADPNRVLTVYQEKRNPPIVFMFSGQGSQYVNMGLELYRTESIFREQIDRCSEILEPHLPFDLRDVLYPGEANVEGAAQKLKQTFITQPALFTIEYALAKLWMSWGVHPEALVGHSIGEYVAACLAGVFSLEDALSLVASRGRLMQELPAGSMLAVPLSEKGILPFLDETLSLAVINAPSLCVVSGEREAIEDLEKQLSSQNLHCRHLHTSHAFHSKMMEPILDAFTAQVRQVRLNPPQIPFVSNVTGTWITSHEATNPSYWAKHLRQTVRFSDCVQELLKEPNRVLLEVGPGRTLGMLSQQHQNKTKEQIVLSSTRHPKEQKSDIAFILNVLGRLWLAGIQVDWSGFYKDERRHRIPLPTYPFERRRHWIEPVEQPQGIPASQAGLTKMIDRCALRAPDQTRPGLGETFVAPGTPIREVLADIWAQVLGLERVGVHDNFFELGGHSLLAGPLFAQIEKATGKRLPLSTLWQAPTVEQLAGILGQEDWSAALSSLVPLQPQGSKPPFFCVHSSCGDVTGFAVWTRHLGPDQPFYGLRARGLDGVQEPSSQTEEMAAHYIREIQTVQPEGPYYLGGYGSGGVVAFEMAQQLQAKGYKIALLVVLYHEAPNSSYREITWSPGTVIDFLRNLPYWLSEFLGLGPTELFRRILATAGAPLTVWRSDEEHPDKVIGAIEAHEQAWRNYVPQVYPGRVTLFRTRRLSLICSFDPEMGWGELAAGGVEVKVIPGSNVSILEEPHAQVLAEQLRACLDEVGEDASK